MKIKHLFLMAVVGLMAASLTSCNHDLSDHFGVSDNPSSGGGSTAVTKITIDLTAIADEYLNDEKTQLKLALGDQVTLSFEILPAEAAGTEVTLTSGDPNIVSIEGLKVTAAGLGTTTVTAKAGDQTATLTVAVVAINLATITPNVGTTEYNVSSDAILTGTLAENYKISIADGVSVTLKDVTINGTDNSSYQWAGITCAGDATIILEGENTVKGFYENYPGILAAVGHTLIIKGTGSLTASPFDGGGTYNSGGAGIGGGNEISCGNIEIQGGTVTATGGKFAAGIGSGDEAGCGTITISGGAVTATGGYYAAGIGSGYEASCGNITISGGTVTATGGNSSAGIGCGKGNTSGNSSCGTITITSGVTKVTATKGGGSNSIGNSGTGTYSTCGTVTIGGHVGAITASPYSYPVPYDAINGKFTINNTGKQVYFAKGNLQAKTTDLGNNWSWGFAENQWDFVGNAAANNAISGNKTVSTNGTVDLFGWSTAANYYGIHNSENDSDYGGDFVDWGGATIGTGWRTLTKDEWDYLFLTRTSGSKVNGMSPSPDNARYTHATINTDNGTDGIHGIILFPDGVTINSSDATYWGGINQYSSWNGSTKCTTSQWNALAAKGFVFLPTTGYRNGTTISSSNDNGYYWSSYTASASSTYAYHTRVVASTVPNTSSDPRKTGFSVRLVYPID